MKLAGFLQDLKRAAQKLEVVKRTHTIGGTIRLRNLAGITFCPVTAVCWYKTQKVFNVADYDRAAVAMQLDLVAACAIVAAADNLHGTDRATRAKLLAAVRTRKAKKTLGEHLVNETLRGRGK